jgi:hypothetical protein
LAVARVRVAGGGDAVIARIGADGVVGDAEHRGPALGVGRRGMR